VAMIVDHCPRCGARAITFDVLAEVFRDSNYECK